MSGSMADTSGLEFESVSYVGLRTEHLADLVIQPKLVDVEVEALKEGGYSARDWPPLTMLYF